MGRVDLLDDRLHIWKEINPHTSKCAQNDVRQRFLRQITGFARLQSDDISAAGHKSVDVFSTSVHHPIQIIPTEVKRKGFDKELAG